MLPSLHLGHLLFPTTAFTAALGIVAALLLSQRTAHRAGVSPDILWNAGIFAVVSAFVLSRLLLVFTSFRTFLQAPLLLLALPSLTLTGLLLSAFATVVYLRLRHVPLRSALDALAAPAALLWLSLALGDLLAGTDPGTPIVSPWSTHSTSSVFARHPVALYAALIALALLLITLHLAGAPRFTAPGSLAALTLALGGLAQFALSFVREPLLVIYTPTPLVEPLQWLSLLAVVAGVLLFLTRPFSPTAPPAAASRTDLRTSPVRSHAL